MGCDCHSSTFGAPGSLSGHLTQQFYEWEKRGRGWQLWGVPVKLEPTFGPFRFRLPVLTMEDDGRRHNFISRWWEKVRGDGLTEPVPNDDVDPAWYLPSCDENSETISEFRWQISHDSEVSPTLALQLLLANSSIDSPIAYELIGTASNTVCQLACRQSAADVLVQQCRGFLPDAGWKPATPTLSERIRQFRPHPTLVVDFGLSEEFMRPLQMFRNFDVDPLSGIIAALNGLRRSELGVFQVLFQPCRHPWAQSMLRAVSDGQGGSFFVDAPYMIAAATEKVSLPLYAVIIRVAACAPTSARTWEIARTIGGALAAFCLPSSNELIPLTNDDYPDHQHLEDLLNRQTRRPGMILNAGELVGFAHPPTESMHRAGLTPLSKNCKAAATLSSDGVTIGDNSHHGGSQPVVLPDDRRTRHTYVIGASGTGKSTLLLNMLVQDMERGHGLALLDPHGDLVDAVLERLPADRLDDVILFDPADTEFPVGLNILKAHTELERILLSSDLVALFSKFASTWGDQMTTVLGNAILAFLESERGGSLIDLRRFLIEKDFRAEFLATVRDDGIVYYWQREFPLLSGRPQSSILTRLDSFLRSKVIRNIVCQRENRLDFEGLMNDRRIFLGRLSQGSIGEENAYLLGTLLMSKFHQAALSRQSMAEQTRIPFFLYIDEFQNLVTPSMASILTGVRKYGLGLVLAHQELRQLEKRDPEVAHSVLANPYARICFRVGDSDAKKLADGFSAFSAEDLLNLGNGEAIVRFEQARQDFNLKTPTAPGKAKDAAARRAQAVAQSRERYAIPREEVEAAFASTFTVGPAPVPRHRAVAPEKNTDPFPASAAEAPVVIEAGKPRKTSSPTLQMGKGGQEHRYLQQLIKRWAEGMGYRASIEKPLSTGGSVDVVLENPPVLIACEIAVTTTPEHELQNLCKCLGEPFTHVAAVGLDAKKVQQVRLLAEQSLPALDRQRVVFCDPAGLFDLIHQLEAQCASHETTVKGYRVNVNYKGLSGDEQAARRELVSKVVVKSLKK